MVVGEGVEECPEAGAMVHFLGVAEFVEEDVVDEVGGKQEEEAGEVDVFFGGAAAPAAAAGIDFDGVVGQVVLGRQGMEAGREEELGVTAQRFFDGFV